MGIINFTTAQLNKMARIVIEPYIYNSYLPTPATGLTITAGQKNKIVLATSTVGVPNGFDLYVTPQGSALRFIGSGFGNGDTAVFSVKSHVSATTTNQSASINLCATIRPYTETDYQNAVQIGGYNVEQNMPNNATEALTLVAPDIVLNDGDLLELCVETDSTITEGFDLNQFSFNIREEYAR